MAIQPSRIGKFHIGGFYTKEVKGSIKSIQALHPGVTEDQLVARALNKLFKEFGVKQTAPQSWKPSKD